MKARFVFRFTYDIGEDINKEFLSEQLERKSFFAGGHKRLKVKEVRYSEGDGYPIESMLFFEVKILNNVPFSLFDKIRQVVSDELGDPSQGELVVKNG